MSLVVCCFDYLGLFEVDWEEGRWLDTVLKEDRKKKIEGSFGLDGYEPSDEVWYARTKEIEGAAKEGQQLEAPEQRLLIEDSVVPAEQEQNRQDNGLLSTSTIAALQGFSRGNLSTQRPSQNAGPLVSYGSDDESD